MKLAVIAEKESWRGICKAYFAAKMAASFNHGYAVLEKLVYASKSSTEALNVLKRTAFSLVESL